MKAPEKIYLDSYGSGFSHGFHTNKLNDNDVEYIRKDAFIEKAYEYLSYHLDTSKIDVNYKFDFIEDFREYMEGK